MRIEKNGSHIPNPVPCILLFRDSGVENRQQRIEDGERGQTI